MNGTWSPETRPNIGGASSETLSAVESVPLPSGALSGYLLGVSCPSTTFCESVGTFNDSSNTETVLAEGYV